jgi:hypothetical protein
MSKMFNVIATEGIEDIGSVRTYTSYSYAEGVNAPQEKWKLVHSRAFLHIGGVADDIHRRLQREIDKTSSKIISDLSEKYRDIGGDFYLGEGINYNLRTGHVINVRTLSAEEKSELVRALYVQHKSNSE